MRKGLYRSLAFTNLKNHRRLYAPYLLACAGSAAMFYMMCFLATHSALRSMRGGRELTNVLVFGSVVIAIFSAVIVLYANSFIMKQRQRELGLYNILGMEKKHIARLMATETVYAAFASLLGGLALGMLFSKLMLLFVCKLLSFDVPFGFEVSVFGLAATCLLFFGIFFLALVWNVSRVHLAKPVELLRAAQAGEREPKTRRLLLLTGLLSLGGGYVLAVVTKKPSAAVVVFFLAVLLVILGTYCLFTAGSVALLKSLRRRKNYYYRTRNFISVSSMIYRMKQNAVGLANICILSTMVLVTLSTTFCLYYGIEDTLRNLHPRNIEIRSSQIDDAERDALLPIIAQSLRESGVTPRNAQLYRSATHWVARDGAAFAVLTGRDQLAQLRFMPLADYNDLTGAGAHLARGEALVYCPNALLPENSARFGALEYRVAGTLDELPIAKGWYSGGSDDVEHWCFIVPETSDLEAIARAFYTDKDEFVYNGYSLYYGFDVANREEEVTFAALLRSQLDEHLASLPEDEGLYLSLNYTDESREGYYAIYGGLFFLGIFLGLMFTCAAALIMYYKQLSEGYGDRARYAIMRKVGLARDEVKASVRAQVLTVFFLPLAAAGVHVAFAFPLISVLFTMLALTNVTLFLFCTLGCFTVFALLYAAVYALTARTYYKIVAEAE